MSFRTKALSVALAIGAIFYPALAHWISTAPIGTTALLDLLIGHAMAVFAALIAIPVLIVQMFHADRPKSLGFWLLISIILVAGAFPAILLGLSVRRNGIERFSDRSLPLIAAIKKYELANLAPPPSLQALVPTYLPAVPSTGMMAYPEYQYVTGPDAIKYHSGNSWALWLNTGYGMAFDQILYFPKQNYPTTGFGGTLETVGVWAYVHE